MRGFPLRGSESTHRRMVRGKLIPHGEPLQFAEAEEQELSNAVEPGYDEACVPTASRNSLRSCNQRAIRKFAPRLESRCATGRSADRVTLGTRGTQSPCQTVARSAPLPSLRHGASISASLGVQCSRPPVEQLFTYHGPVAHRAPEFGALDATLMRYLLATLRADAVAAGPERSAPVPASSATHGAASAASTSSSTT